MCTGLDIQTTSRSLTVKKAKFLAVLSEILRLFKTQRAQYTDAEIHGKCNRRVTSKVMRIDHPIKCFPIPYCNIYDLTIGARLHMNRAHVRDFKA